MKLTRPTSSKPAFKSKAAPKAEQEKKNQNDEMDLQDVVRILTDVTKQNKDFAEGLNVLTQKVDQIVKSIADVMKANQEFCTNVIQEISAISEYINIQPEDEQAQQLLPEKDDEEVEEAEEAESADEEGITAEDIMAMKKSELIALIDDNELPIDPAKYPKVGDLRKALIQYLEEEYDAENDEGDEDSPDDGDTADFEEVGEGEDVSGEDDEPDDDGAEGSPEADDDEDDW